MNEHYGYCCDNLPTTPRPDLGTMLITGASGYVGGRLVQELIERGYKVRVMVRVASPEHNERWPCCEIAIADALDPEGLNKALEGVHTAFYLIHSLLLGKSFESAELQAAVNFRIAAEAQKVKRIIYLGGLGDTRSSLSPHLKSRNEVADELKRGKVPVTILRAAIIIGSGSASYELIKNLAKRMHFLLIPRWANTECQPIAIEDVRRYLVGALETPETSGKSFDIGGREILPYRTIFTTIADILGKKIWLIPFPVSSMGPYIYLANLLTPVPGPIVKALLKGIKNKVVCENDEIRQLIPFRPLAFKEAILRAMTREEQDAIHTRWSDAYPPAHDLAMKLHEVTISPRYTGSSCITTSKNPASLFSSVCRIGGKEGWFRSNWLWRARGIIDKMLMGVGTARGRRSNSTLRINDVIDFWRVENLIPGKKLLLRAEMKLSGMAWLEFKISQKGKWNRLSLKAYYQPRGLWGIIYWYLVLPLHHIVFNDLVEQIEKRA